MIIAIMPGPGVGGGDVGILIIHSDMWYIRRA